jgi:hypothetical protein
VLGDALEDVLEVALRIDAVELTGLDERVDDRCALPTRVRAKEEVIGELYTLLPGYNSRFNGRFRVVSQ